MHTAVESERRHLHIRNQIARITCLDRKKSARLVPGLTFKSSMPKSAQVMGNEKASQLVQAIAGADKQQGTYQGRTAKDAQEPSHSRNCRPVE